MVKVDAEQAAQWLNRRWKCVNQSHEEVDDTRFVEILLVATTSQVRPELDQKVSRQAID